MNKFRKILLILSHNLSKFMMNNFSEQLTLLLKKEKLKLLEILKLLKGCQQTI